MQFITQRIARLTALFWISLAGQCLAQGNTPWRFWDTRDGFDEAYANSLAHSPDGNVWVKHGAVSRMNRLDGYASSGAPDPGDIGKIEAAPDGTLWIWIGRQLKRFADSKWTSYAVEEVSSTGILRTGNLETWLFTSRVSPFLHSSLILLPLDRNRVLIMLPDRVLEFDATSESARVAISLEATGLKRFGGLRSAADGAVYLSGYGGVGRLRRDGPGRWNWEAFQRPVLPYVDFEEPIGTPEGGVLVTGITGQSATAALSFDGHRWRELYKGTARTLRAWPGAAGSVWVQDGNHILELAGGAAHVAERNGALSGVLLSVLPEAPGHFWVSSSQGLAHYMPALWQTPPEAPLLDDVVSAITEDRAGRIWFAAARQLVCFDNAHWTAYPFPKDMTTWAIFTDGLAILKNGSVAIRTAGPELLLFDPASRAFRVVKHPQGRRTRIFLGQDDGTLLVETFAPQSYGDGDIQRFDGEVFSPYLKPPETWRNGDMRSFYVAPGGEIWGGGTNFIGVLRSSGYRTFGLKNGFADPGAYYIHQDRAGHVTAGGRDGLYGLIGGKWTRLQSGLDRVRNIITSRDGTLWTASGTGVHRYKNGVWLSNGEEEGLPSSVAYKVFEDSRGRIWAGTTRGIGLFHPEADGEAPRAILIDKQNQREAPPGGSMRVVFSGIDKWKFTQLSRLLFSYRMDGGTWSAFAPVNSAQFENLPPGAHRFEVRAMDRNGNIGAAPAVHTFSVLVPWYRTSGFRWSAIGSISLIGLLLTMACLSYSHRGHLITQLNRKRQLERDSQTILQMMAARESIPLILQRIAVLFAAETGVTCVVFRDTGSCVECFPAPSLPRELTDALGRLTPGRLWEDLAFLEPNTAGRCMLVPVRSGRGELLGAIAWFQKGVQIFPGAATWLETFSDLAAAAIENARLYDRLEYQTRHDALTGLPNRVFFEDRLHSSLAAAKAAGGGLALLYVDLDRFKHVNDTLGHRVGDMFLKLVAARLSGVLVSGQTLCRVGGDEFTVLVQTGTGKPAVEELAQNLLAALRSPIALESRRLPASASIGIAIFPENGETPSTLQKHADAAMYRAKAGGKNRYEFFSAELMSTTTAAINTEQLLHRALDEGLFELHYQPQFTLHGELAGLEALLRMRDSSGTLLRPADFVPVAEETGLIVQIGEWVLREACSQLREWMDAGLDAVKIAINVSALQIVRPSFADEVMAVLAEMQVDPRLLELELTESAIMGNLTESRRQMEKLRALGVGLAVDDFGTGYSSLAYLQNLPINVLKIDRSFVQAITGASGGLPMVQAILALARNLGLTVVAEGVETEGQLMALRDSRCDYLQGFLLCPPEPADVICGYLGDSRHGTLKMRRHAKAFRLDQGRVA